MFGGYGQLPEELRLPGGAGTTVIKSTTNVVGASAGDHTIFAGGGLPMCPLHASKT
jgi:hypothetical protein